MTFIAISLGLITLVWIFWKLQKRIGDIQQSAANAGRSKREPPVSGSYKKLPNGWTEEQRKDLIEGVKARYKARQNQLYERDPL